MLASLYITPLNAGQGITRPDQWLKDTYRVDGWTAFHGWKGSQYGSLRINRGLQEYLNYRFGLQPPSDMRILVENFIFDVFWEAGQYYKDGWYWPDYNNKYHGHALQNMIIDTVASGIGCFLSIDNYWVRNVLFWIDDRIVQLFTPSKWRLRSLSQPQGIIIEAVWEL